MSLIFHGIAFGAVPLSAAWQVTFPAQAPSVMTAYSLVEPPPPPPPPPAPPKSQVIERARPTELPAAYRNLAPTVIPDEIPTVTAEVEQVEIDSGMGEGVEGGVVGGIAGGVVGGTIGGIVGGHLGGEAAIVPEPVDEGRVVIPRDQELRMFALSKTYPSYPERARMQRWEDQLVVRYVIGTNGRVKEVIILDPATRKIFDEAAVSAIRHWRFRPMIKDGKAMEVEHELTVYFKLTV